MAGTPLTATDPLGLDGDCTTETQEQALRDGSCSITVYGNDGSSTIFDFSDVGYYYCALMGCSGGPAEMTVDGACGSYGCTVEPEDTGSPVDSGGGGSGSAPAATAPGVPQGSITAACGWDPVCYWLDGMSGALVNNSGKDLAVAAAATSAGVIGEAVATSQAVVGTVTSAASAVAKGYQFGVYFAFTHPELVLAIGEAISNAVHGPDSPETPIGRAVALSHAAIDDWDAISGWLRGR